MANRLTLMSQGQWAALWASVEGAPRGSRTARATQLEVDVRRVATLMQAGERSRAAAAAWGGGGGVPVEEVERKLEETQEGARGMEGTRRRLGIGRELEEGIANRIAETFGRYPRRAGAGPGGGSFEHWGMLQQDPVTAKTVARTLTRLASGAVPEDVLRGILAARLSGLPKAAGGCRIIGCGSVIRRLVARAVAQEGLPALKRSLRGTAARAAA